MKKSLLFIATLLILNAQPSHAENIGLFAKLDDNKDNQLCFEEFSQIRPKQDERVMQAFNQFDSNNDTFIDQNEWWDMLEAWASRE